jgi:hypothetical protein
MLAARASVVVDGSVVDEALIRAAWGEEVERPTRMHAEAARRAALLASPTALEHRPPRLGERPSSDAPSRRW